MDRIEGAMGTLNVTTHGSLEGLGPDRHVTMQRQPDRPEVSLSSLYRLSVQLLPVSFTPETEEPPLILPPDFKT